MLLNILSVSGINSDSDLPLEWKLMRKDKLFMVLPVFPKKIPIVRKIILEIELYPYSLIHGLLLILLNTVSVLMIMLDKILMSVQALNLTIIMLMVIGSTFILDILVNNRNHTLHLLVMKSTKQLLLLLLLIMHLHLDWYSI